MEIRYITKSDDRLAISKVYEESWKYVYQGIVPQHYLDHISEGQWASHIEQADRNNMVMVQDGIIIGTSGFGKSRTAEMDGFGEIISIYLLPEYMGKGYGRLLLRAVVDELKKIGFDKVFLWVLEENQNARHFYEKFGFVQSERCLVSNIGGKELKEVQYCYYNRNMIRIAEMTDLDSVLQITKETISHIYPHYYAEGVVDFFLKHHSRENVLSDIEKGMVWLLEIENRLVGTVTIKENAVNRLFVLPEYQSHGYGSQLMDFAEAKIAESFSRVHIDSSLAAKEMYLKRGYKETKTCKILADHGDILVYDEMEKWVKKF